MAALARVCAWGLMDAAALGTAKAKAPACTCAWVMRTSVAWRGYAGHFAGMDANAGSFDAASGCIFMLQ